LSAGLLLGAFCLVLALCGLAQAGYQVASGRWQATPVLSGSMRPGVQPGDVVLTQRVPISDLHVRDVVVFHAPEGDRFTVHRIVELGVIDGATSITTWGDANPVADAAVTTLPGSTVYRVARIIPLVGYPAVWLQNGSRGVIAIGVGALLLVGAAVTVLRPDKPTKPTGSGGSDGSGEAGPTDLDSWAVTRSWSTPEPAEAELRNRPVRPHVERVPEPAKP
jgi:signal peptidase I